MKKPLFERTTLGLYDNPETENWITTSFADRYHPSHAPEFKVNWIQLMNEGGQSYIEVSLFFPEDVEFLVNNTAIVWKDLCTTADGKIKLSAFKSYRMSKEYLTNLLEEIWFWIDGRLESDNRLQIAPVLYKKPKI